MSEEKLIEKRVGYSIILISLLLLGFAVSIIADHFFIYDKELVVYFPRVGQLKPEQPLVYNGITIGTVADLEENVYDGVAVKIILNRNIEIREGYHFYSEDKDLFGTKRQIALINGPEGAKPVRPTKKLRGSYYVGVPEIVSSTAVLDEQLNKLRDSLKAYLNGDSTSLRFFVAVRALNENRDEISRRMDNFQRFVESDVIEVVDQLETITVKSSKAAKKIERKLPAIEESLDSTIVTLSSTIEKIPQIITAVDSFITVTKDIESSNKMTNVIEEIKIIQEDLERMKSDAHKLRLILKRNRD